VVLSEVGTGSFDEMTAVATVFCHHFPANRDAMLGIIWDLGSWRHGLNLFFRQLSHLETGGFIETVVYSGSSTSSRGRGRGACRAGEAWAFSLDVVSAAAFPASSVTASISGGGSSILNKRSAR